MLYNNGCVYFKLLAYSFSIFSKFYPPYFPLISSYSFIADAVLLMKYRYYSACSYICLCFTECIRRQSVPGCTSLRVDLTGTWSEAMHWFTWLSALYNPLLWPRSRRHPKQTTDLEDYMFLNVIHNLFCWTISILLIFNKTLGTKQKRGNNLWRIK
jgi:hypothetical protein